MRHGLSGQITDGTPDGDGPGGDGGPPGGDEPAVHSPSRYDPIARAASTVVGGPAGRRLASRTGFWGAVPVLVLLSAAVLSVAVVQKQHCRAQGWATPDQFWHACYSDIPVVYGSAALGSEDRRSLVDALGQGGGVGQPPLSGALMWLASAFVPDTDPDAARQFFDLSAVLLTVVLAVAVAAVALTLRRRPWDAAHVALSPVLVTAGLISYQLLAVALVGVALLVLARGRPVVAGLVLGLAVAAAPQTAVVGVVVAFLAGRHLRAGIGAAFAGSALACWLVARALLLPGYTGQLRQSWEGWVDAIPGYGSLWLLPQLLANAKPGDPTSRAVDVLVAVFGWIFEIGPLSPMVSAFLALVLLGVLALAILRYTVYDEPLDQPPLDEPVEGLIDPAVDGTPDGISEGRVEGGEPVPLPAARTDLELGRFVTEKVAPVSLALLAAVLVVSKALPLQASLLLLPLMALSGLRWRDHLIWACAELAYFVAIWLYIGGETTPSRGLPASFYLFFVIARLAAISWIGVQAVQAFRSPPGRVAPAGTAGPDSVISSPDVGEGRLLDDRDTATAQHPG